MNLICPFCGQPVPDRALDIDNDMMTCVDCGESCILSDLREGRVPPRVDIQTPPPGAWLVQFEDGFRAGYTLRALPMLLFLIPFTLVWSGGSLGGLYGSQITSGQFDLFKSIFGLPFLVGTLVLIAVNLMCAFGKVEVTVTPAQGEIFIGALGLGWRRRFDPATVIAVLETQVFPDNPKSGMLRQIELKTASQSHVIKMSTKPEQQRFLFGVLYKYLTPSR